MCPSTRMGSKRALLPLLVFVFCSSASSQHTQIFLKPVEPPSTICEITVPIATWLANNSGPCAAVKGHFVLNKTANNFTRQIFSTFSNLKRIEGCIYVREFTGSRNLSFFSNLEEVICRKREADLSNLTNVIDIVEPSLTKMGFNSLTKVEGPGQIVLSYEEEQQSYYHQRAKDGVKCFSKQEQIFLAYHPQFRMTMYQTCETDDPCFRLDYFKMWYTVADIPKNCFVFVGAICLLGPFEENRFLNSFQNLTLLIGQLHVMGTLFDDINAIFPKLKNIYPFERPNMNNEHGKTCNEVAHPAGTDPTQFVHVNLNRFLVNMSLPSLLPIRPLDVSRNFEAYFTYDFVDAASYLPDTIADPCSDFPNFTCGYYINPKWEEEDLENRTFIQGTWILSMICVAIGVAFSIRSMVILQFSHASKGLPYTRSLIILVIFISTLVALESCIFYQKTYTTFTGSMNSYYHFPEFESSLLIYLPIQWAMCILVACKHACLAIIILCYVDIIIFYRTGSYRISSNYCAVVLLCAAILTIHLNSQLAITIRGRRPNYSKDRYIVFIPFIMNVDYAENFTKFVPDELYVKYYSGILRLTTDNGLEFRLDQIPLETFGQALLTYSNTCDILMVAVVTLFYLLTYRHVIIPGHSFTILIALYLQLSTNRIRHYLYSQILINDYCVRYDYDKHAQIMSIVTCYDEFDYTDTSKWDLVNGYAKIRDVAFMEKYQWAILEKLLEKLSYVSYPIVSFYCYIFAKYHHYFGAVVYYREMKKDKTANVPVNKSANYRSDKTKN